MRVRAFLCACFAAANPEIDLYRGWAIQYERDAEAAEASTKYYSDLAKKAVQETKASTAVFAKADFDRRGIKPWAEAGMKVEALLRNPAPEKATKAAAKAAAPYIKAYNDYMGSHLQYLGAAAGYQLRADMDSDLGKKLQTYGNQYKLEGNDIMSADMYAQSGNLLKAGKTFGGMASDYNKMASKLIGVLPGIQSMAGKAADFAAYGANPRNSPMKEQVYPFTIAPPLDFLQEDERRALELNNRAAAAPLVA